MRTNDKTIYNTYHTTAFKDADGTPVRRFGTFWFPCNMGFFRIHLSIIRPKSEKPKGYFSLTYSQTERILQAISHMVEFLKEQLR